VTAGARVLLFTGKGGVGKTTTAAATALTLAERGARVVLTSADPAHSLSDALEVPLGSAPEQVAPGCWAQQLDALERMESSWGEIRSWLVEVMDWAGLSAMEAEELAVLPGFEELVALLEIDRLAGCGRYDVVIVDCAPTAESIRLLSLPDLLGWYMERLFPASRRMTRLVRPVLARMTDLPVASAEVFDAGERFHRQIESVRRLLTDAARTSVRLVLTPERMSVAEARRTHTYLSLFGYHVDAVVVNRVLPAEGRGAFLTAMRAAQRVQLDVLDDAFAPLPVLPAAHAPGEVLGVEAMREHGRRLWALLDPCDDLCPGRGLELEHRDGMAVLSFELPGASAAEVEVGQSDTDLAVAVGPYRRNLALPDSLRRRPVRRARVRDGRLEVIFDRAIVAGCPDT
jgi:arsenite-transporting ATPase